MIDRVLLVGSTGELGRHFVSALRDGGMEVILLLRPETVTAPGDKRELIASFLRNGATIVEGALEDEASVERACTGAEAILSCVSHWPQQLNLQSALVRAAAKSGTVRRIIPSQFGIDSRSYRQSRVDHGDVKRDLQRLFDNSGVAVTYIHANGFASRWAASLGQLGLLVPPTDHVNLYGDGNVKLAMVVTEDIARYAARALADERTENRHVSISPAENLLTQNELIELWESKTGRRLRRDVISAQELDDLIARLAETSQDRVQLSFNQLIRAVWIDGLGGAKRGADVLELTELYPDIRYGRVTEYLDQFVSVT